MPTDYRLICVVRAARVAEANTAARTIDPSAGDEPFSAPLRFISSPSTQIDVYVTSWRMEQGTGGALRQALRSAGFSNREIGLINPGGTPNMGDDLWVFDATEETPGAWTYEQVRSALGLTFIQSVRA